MAALNRTTPAEAETHSDRQAELEALVAQATFKYSVKDYDAAAELYSQATELQAELNGEMASENADLLYAYGRCLYHAAVRNSDVLGSKVAGEKQQAAPEKTSKPRGKQSNSVDTGLADNGMGLTEAGVASTGGGSEASATSEDVQDEAGKPYFQFTGDENFDDSDVESNIQEPEGEAGEGAEEEDDFANAFEVLDLARVLLLKRLQEEEGQEQGKSTGVDNAEETRHLKERLADTHDLQAEISLEGERFPNAADDLRAALALKMELFPQESSLIAEAHYKLSLALEFSSVTQQKTENGESGAGAHIDEAMREEAAKEMEASIASCKLRITKEEADLRARGSTNGGQGAGLGKGKAITQRDIDDVRDMVTDMEQRLIELRSSPISINDSSTGANGDVGGILGSILGDSPAAQQEKLKEASKGAKDLSKLVKRKKPSANAASETVEDVRAKNGGKRKVEFVEEVVEVGTGKKARLLDGDDDEA